MCVVLDVAILTKRRGKLAFSVTSFKKHAKLKTEYLILGYTGM